LRRGDLAGIKGRRIAAVPFVAAALRRLLAAAGLDPQRDGIDIVSPQSALRPGVNFGVAAAEALANRTIDGFFANGMGAAIVTTSGAGNIILDIRRGDGPAACFNYTMPAIATTERLIADRPEAAAGVVRAIIRTQQALRADIRLAAKVGAALFPAQEAALIADIVARDLPFYAPGISAAFVDAMNHYAADVGLLRPAALPYDRVVATQFADLWNVPNAEERECART
jgi:ABC-type nitrate/sulfonate/bicarbonate transport system substrate-binding protein